MMYSFYEYLGHIERYDNTPAVTDATLGYTLTYRDLCHRIYGYAHYLKQTQKCKPGDVIALYHLRGIDWVIAFFAAQLCDSTCISFDERMNDELCTAFIETTNAHLLITPEDEKHFWAPCKRVSFGFKKPRNSFAYTQSGENVVSEILLTSGTWSIPKGVTLTQQNILTNLHDNLQQFTPTPDDRLLSILPLSHAYAQMCDLLMPLYCGSQVVYTTKLDPQSLTSALRDYSITIFVCVPRILESIHRSILRKVPPRLHRYTPLVSRNVRRIPLSARRALFATIHKSISPSLKTLAVGGAPLDPKIDAFFQALGYKVLVGYGLSETSPIISIRSEAKGTPGSVGIPHRRLDLKLSKQNEILVRGESVFAGYYPEARSDDYFNTQDVGYLKNGQLFLTGRTRNLIVYPNGDKLSIEDIEHIADTTKGVLESIVHTADPTTLHPDHIVLIVSTTDDYNEELLRKRLSSTLPFSVRIKRIISIGEQPLQRTHTLKLARLKNYHHFENLLKLDHK